MYTDIAYIDPASGSALVAAVLSGATGLLLFIKQYWRTILTKLKQNKE